VVHAHIGLDSDAQPWASKCPDVKNDKWRLNPFWHGMLYSCTHMATVGVKGLRIYSVTHLWLAGGRGSWWTDEDCRRFKILCSCVEHSGITWCGRTNSRVVSRGCITGRFTSL